jgi:hypothetical protein
MKIFLKTIILTSSLFLLTGCSQKVEFSQNYIEANVKKDLKKVNTEEVDIKKNENLYLKKHPNGFRGSATTLDINLGSLNENVLREFTTQYFNQVSVVPALTDNLYIESKFYNYEYVYGFSDGNEVEVFVEMKVFYKNKLILEKKYNIKNDITALTLNFTLAPLVEENFHKTLLKLYETKFKPDLLRALENNK